jgi:hypothetical protein
MSADNKRFLPILTLAPICLCVGALFSQIHADGFGGGMGHTKQRQDGGRSQQPKRLQASSAQLDAIDIQTQKLEKELGFDDLQKIKIEKFADELRDNLRVLNSIKLEYGQFMTGSTFDGQSFIASAQSKSKPLSGIQSEFIQKLFSILTDDQKQKLKAMRLRLLWQIDESDSISKGNPD